MRSKKRLVRNKIIASQTRAFFEEYQKRELWRQEDLATVYAQFFWDQRSNAIIQEHAIAATAYDVSLGIGQPQDFDRIAKRSILVSNTLLISHAHTGDYHRVGDWSDLDEFFIFHQLSKRDLSYSYPLLKDTYESLENHGKSVEYGIKCPNLEALSQFLLDSQSLMEAGLLWYLPSYALAETRYRDRFDCRTIRSRLSNHMGPIDYLVHNRRAIQLVARKPYSSKFIQPMIHLRIPVIENASLRDFSSITVEELLGTYGNFQRFLRPKLEEINDQDTSDEFAMQGSLIRLQEQIEDGLMEINSEITKIKRKRSVIASGAVFGTVGAVLVKVYGPALDFALTTLGMASVTGGVLGTIYSYSDNETKRTDLKKSPFYYIWLISNSNEIDLL